LTNVFPIADIMFCCRDMFGQSSKSIPKSVFAPQAVGVNTLESSDQIFQIAVISVKWIRVQVWLRSVQSRQRLGVEKKEGKKEKATAVKY